MTILISASFLFIAVAIFLLFKISGKDITQTIYSLENTQKKTLKNLIKNKENRIVKFLKDTEQMTLATGRKGKFHLIVMMSLVLIIIGISLGIGLKNIYIIPVSALAFGSIPFIFIKFQYIEYNKILINELSSSLHLITSSYERTENILESFKENVDDVNEPVRGVFLSFINEIEHINPDYEKAINNMSNKIDNNIWREWCDSLKKCTRNRTLKYTLEPIVTKLVKIQVVADKMQNLLMKATKDYWLMTLLALGLVLVGTYVMPNSLMVEIDTSLSNLLISINFAFAIFSAIRVSIITHEIKFDM